MSGSSEVGRQLVHILAGGFALLLRWLTWWQAALFAMAAVLFNVYVLPRVGRAMFRPGDLDAPERSGIVIYPMAVLGLILCFPARLEIAAAAWAILAAGDGFATLVGTHLKTPPLPWNRAKSVGGSLAFMAFGSAAGMALAAWVAQDVPGIPAWWIVAAPITAAVVSGLVETVPIRLNDNISVPIAAAIVLWAMSLVHEAALQSAVPALVGRVPVGVALNALVAAAGWRAGTVTVSGAVTGAVIGLMVFAGTGWRGWVLLFASFAAAAVTTRTGYRRKALVGIAETRGGRRGPGNAIANTGVAACAALLSAAVTFPDVARLAMVAALVTSASDTVASEIGKAWGRTTWLVIGFRRVAPGTSGAISAEGTIAGVGAAAILAGLAAFLGLIPASWIAPVVLAATGASLIESALGATLEAPGILNNDALNLVNSMAGAALAVAIAPATF